MKTVCKTDQCAGCMACVDICSRKAITVEDSLLAYNAVIDEKICVDCGLCRKVCQNNNLVDTVEPNSWFQGWAKNKNIRNKASSGGLASAIAEAFIETGGIVYRCFFENGEFKFSAIDNKNFLKSFYGSKYVKSNPVGVYKNIKEDLEKNKKILFIGLPCQVAAVKNYIRKDLQDNLYTVDLVCHGSPSPNMLNCFLKQYEIDLKDISDICFRVKDRLQINDGLKNVMLLGMRDCFSTAFVNGLISTENCYQCTYATLKRVSDITVGDSWGSSLPHEEKIKGISLVLCQTAKGEELLNSSDIHLVEVNLDKAVENNRQLQRPSEKPNKRKEFFDGIKAGKNFNDMVFQIFPRDCIKQIVKGCLIHLKVVKFEGATYSVFIKK